MSSVLSSNSVRCAFIDNKSCSFAGSVSVAVLSQRPCERWPCLSVVHCSVYILDAVYKAAGEQSGPAVPLQCAFEPAVFPLPVNEHNVALLKFQLGLALGRIWHHHPVPLTYDGPRVMLLG